MKAARETATEVILKTKVDLRWVDRTEPYRAEGESSKPRQQAPAYLMFIVKTAHGLLQQKTRTLGFASTNGKVPQAFIFYDRINQGNEVPRLPDHSLLQYVLGHAIAHELAHLVLGPGHSRAGLMRATWDLSDLQQMFHGGLPLTAGQAERFRSKIASQEDVWCNTAQFYGPERTPAY